MKSLLNLNIVNLRNDLNNVKSLTRKNIEDGQNFIKKEFEDQKKKIKDAIKDNRKCSRKSNDYITKSNLYIKFRKKTKWKLSS